MVKAINTKHTFMSITLTLEGRSTLTVVVIPVKGKKTLT